MDASVAVRSATVRANGLQFEVLEAGSGPLALLNSGLDGEPLYLIDGGESLAVYFVPAGSEE